MGVGRRPRRPVAGDAVRFAFWIGWEDDAQDRYQPNRNACLDISDMNRGVSVQDWLILIAAQPIRNADGRYPREMNVSPAYPMTRSAPQRSMAE